MHLLQERNEMGRIWEYVYWRLPLGKRQFFDKVVDIKQAIENIKRAIEISIRDNYNYKNELYGKLESLTGEVKILQEENARLEKIITHYHKQDMQMFWQEYRREGESTADAQKRFFLALPEAKGVTRNLQLLEKDLLKALITICDAHDIPCWLYSGTLLGAVRHKGFIPWDDDLDTCMAREDIDKLRDILKDNTEYKLTVKYDPWGYCKQIRFCYKDSQLPVFVDVFPCDWACTATKETWEANYKVRMDLKAEMKDESNPFIREFRTVGCVDDNSAMGKQVAKIFDRYYNSLKEQKVLCDKEEAEGFLFGYDSWNPCYDSNINAVAQVFPLKRMEFEGIECNVPNKYMEILCELYGEDIYTFPCGEPHFLHADWKKNAKLLETEVKKRIK